MGGYFMLDTILSEDVLKRFVAEMRTSITNYGFRDPKSGEYIIFQEFQYHPVVYCPARNYFNPLGHIVNSHQNVEDPRKEGNGPMKSIPHTLNRSTTKIRFKGIM